MKCSLAGRQELGFHLSPRREQLAGGCSSASSQTRVQRSRPIAIHSIHVGLSLDQPLVLAATLDNASLTLRFRCAPKRGALAATGARFDKLVALDRSALWLELESVRVRIDGDILVSVESAAQPEDEHSSSHTASSGGASGGASPSMLWRLFSKALSSTLRELVEQHAALAIHETLQVMLDDAMRGGGLPHTAEPEEGEPEREAEPGEAQAVPAVDHDVTPAVDVVAAGQECE